MGVTKDRVVNVHIVIRKLEESLQRPNPGNPMHYVNILKSMFSEPQEPNWQCDPPETYPDIPEEG